MGQKIGLIVLGIFFFWFGLNMALGPSGSGSQTNYVWAGGPNATPQPGELPQCVKVHTYSTRGWTGHELIRSDVWVTGCNNAEGQLRVASGPTCTAETFLGPGTAFCSSAPSGNDLRVSVAFDYGFLNQISGQLRTSTFTISPSGNYSAP